MTMASKYGNSGYAAILFLAKKLEFISELEAECNWMNEESNKIQLDRLKFQFL